MSKFLKYLDFFPQSFKFTYKGKAVIKTKWGGFFSLIAFLIIFFNTYLIGKDIFYRVEPQVLEYIETDKSAPTRRINYNRNIFAYKITDLNNELFWDETIMQLKPVIYLGKKNKKGIYKYREYELEMTECETELKKNLTQVQFEKEELEEFAKNKRCIKNFDSYLAGGWNDEFIMYFMVKLETCRNKTLEERKKIITNVNSKEEDELLDDFEKEVNSLNYNRYDNVNQFFDGDPKIYDYLRKYEKEKEYKEIICKPQEEIEKQVNNKWLIFYLNSIESNPVNFKKPMNFKLHTFWGRIGNESFKRHSYYYDNFVSSTDTGFIFDDTHVDDSRIAFSDVTSDYNVKKPSDELLFRIEYYINSKFLIFSRHYIKLQNISAYMGGILSLILNFFKVISIPFFTKKLNLKILNELFEFDKNEDSEEEDKKIPRNIELKRTNNNLKRTNLKDLNFSFNKNEKNNENNNSSKENGNNLINDFPKAHSEKNDYFKFDELDNEYKNDNDKSKGYCHQSHSNSRIRNSVLNFIEDKSMFPILNKKNENEIENSKINYQNNDDNLDQKKEHDENEDNPNKNYNSSDRKDLKKCETKKIVDLLIKEKEEKENEKEKEKEQKEEKKIYQIFKEIMNKMKFTNFEIFRTSYFLTCFNKRLERKKYAYNLAVEDIHKATDYLEIIKLKRHFKIMQYLLLDSEIIKSFPFIGNPKKNDKGYNHEFKEYAEIFVANLDIKENLNKVSKYFEKKIQFDEMNVIDKKVWGIINPKIKNVFDHIENEKN